MTIAVPAKQAHAGGWTQEQGKHYTKVWFRGLVGGSVFLLESPTLPTGGTYRDFSVNYYYEYGLIDQLTLVAFGTPAGYASYQDPAVLGSTGYIGSNSIGLRWKFYDGPVKLALEAHYGFTPRVGEKRIGHGKLRGKTWFYTPIVSTHRFDAELQLGYGFSVGEQTNGWISLTGGAKAHTRSKMNPVIYSNFQLGFSSKVGINLAINIMLHHLIPEIEEINVSGAGQTRYLGNGVTLGYWFTKNWGVTASVEGIFYAFANASTPSIIFGIEHK